MVKLELEVTEELYQRLKEIADRALVSADHIAINAMSYYASKPTKGLFGFSFPELAQFFSLMAEMESRGK